MCSETIPRQGSRPAFTGSSDDVGLVLRAAQTWRRLRPAAATALLPLRLVGCLEAGFSSGKLILFLLSLVFWFSSMVSRDLK